MPLPAAAAPDDEATDPGDAGWTPRQAEAWGDVMGLAAAVRADRMTSRDAVLRPRRSRRSRWWPSACIPSAAIRCCSSPCRRRWPSSSAPAPTCAPSSSAAFRSATASRSPSSCGSIAGAARCSWPRRATTCGASCGCSTPSPPPPRSCASASRARSTRRAASTWRAGWRAPSSRRSGARPSTSTAATCALRPSRCAATSRRPRARTWRRPKRARPSRSAFWWRARPGAGKSSLVNALANAVDAAVDALPATARFTAYRLTHEGLPAALVIDSPGLTGAGQFDALIEAADDCDMVLWVVSAARAARDIDARALAAIREHFAGRAQSPPAADAAGAHAHRPAAPLQRVGAAL